MRSIQSLKADIIRAIDAQGKDIRLIASGKILKPDSELVGNFKLGVCLMYLKSSIIII